MAGSSLESTVSELFGGCTAAPVFHPYSSRAFPPVHFGSLSFNADWADKKCQASFVRGSYLHIRPPFRFLQKSSKFFGVANGPADVLRSGAVLLSIHSGL